MSILFSHFLSKNNEIVPQGADFTEMLGSIAVVPKKLYFYGKMPENVPFPGSQQIATNCPEKRQNSSQNSQKMVRPKVLAIVGTRKPTNYGREIAYKLAYEAAKRGVVVVSGLAYGIDSVAHRGALDAGGVTVAVLGTPIDYIYPKQHFGLAEEIVEKGGAVMSELGPGEKYHFKACFLQRNRIIAGLADAVMIPEAAERSGSLNTAAHALEQGREVFAAPGDIGRLSSRGCNKLIRQGAIPYLEPKDVLEVLLPEVAGNLAGKLPGRTPGQASGQMKLFGDTELETVILRSVAAGFVEGEEILATVRDKLPESSVAEFNQAITMLEIKGQVRGLGANRWELR